MNIKKKILMGVAGLFSALTLVFTSGGTDVHAYYEQMQFKENYNSDALDAFGITNSYFNDYFEMNRKDIYYSLRTSSGRRQLAKDGLLMFSWEGIQLSHAAPSQVNNGITIHYIDGDFRIVGSGGSYAIDNLFLAYVRDLSGFYNQIIEEQEHRTPTQPRILVKGRKVELYVPYVYYTKNQRKYVEKQLENKLEILTGAKFDVTFKSSKKSSVKKYDKKYGYNFASGFNYYNHNIYDFISQTNANVLAVPRNRIPAYENGNYMAYPDYIILDNTLEDVLKYLANKWHGGVSPYTERIALGNLTWNLFYGAKVKRVIFEDYTVTLRAGKYLDIEPSDEYLNLYYNEGVIK